MCAYAGPTQTKVDACVRELMTLQIQNKERHNEKNGLSPLRHSIQKTLSTNTTLLAAAFAKLFTRFAASRQHVP